MVSIVYGALVAIGQTDMYRLIAYTSVSHFGFIILGIFAFTEIGGSGSMVYMVAHGLSTAALFIVAGYLVKRRGSSLIPSFGGVQRVAPILAGFFLFAGLSSLAMPGLASFVGELTVLIGSYQRWPVAAADRRHRDRALVPVRADHVPARGTRPGDRERQGHA